MPLRFLVGYGEHLAALGFVSPVKALVTRGTPSSRLSGDEGRCRTRAAYSQGTERVKPTVAKNFLQSVGLAAGSAAANFSGAAVLADAWEIEEFSLRRAWSGP
jgi:hypothetical protein